jgi:glycosyltransferase involved in cell wall biosynthesis
MERPEVSVLMAVYNGRPYLETSVRSILNQTFEDFEFIVINDGSTDGSGEVLEQFAVSDKRIRVFHQENRGIVSSLNRGLEEAKGEYVARMDADDISLPKRLECQVHFLDSNPEIGIVGTQHVWIGRDGEVTHRPTLPTNSSFISWRLLFETCIVHPSILARRFLIQRLDGYADWAKYGEDYELWTRAVLEANSQKRNKSGSKRRSAGQP